MRILFVDDECRVLDGLRRTLRPMREQWEMLFAEGGVNALKVLSQQSVDIIVTDMQMPGMGGYDLLNAVLGEYPQMKRIVLSGYSRFEAEVRAANLVDAYLTKPCGLPELKQAIQAVAASAS